MKNNDFLKNTTPEQRARIRWEQKMLARQGYYPWGKPPFGFDKVRTKVFGRGLPTLKLNKDGTAVVALLHIIHRLEVKSKREAASFLIAETGLHPTSTRLMAILKNPAFKGMLECDIGWVKGQYDAPMAPEQFDQVQAILTTWKGKQ